MVWSVIGLMLGAAATPQLALPTVSAVNVDPQVAAFLSEHLAHELKSEGLPVITAREIASLLGMERQRELLGCSTAESSCAASLANALGVKAVVLVSIAKLGDTLRSTVDVISASDGKTLGSCADKSPNEDKVADALTACARHLARVLRPEETAAGRSSARLLAWVPVGLGAAAVVAGAVFFTLGSSSYSTLNGMHDPPLGADQAVAAREAGKRDFVLGTVLSITGAVVALAGGAALLFTRPVAVALVPLPGGAAIALAGAWP